MFGVRLNMRKREFCAAKKKKNQLLKNSEHCYRYAQPTYSREHLTSVL